MTAGPAAVVYVVFAAVDAAAVDHILSSVAAAVGPWQMTWTSVASGRASCLCGCCVVGRRTMVVLNAARQCACGLIDGDGNC